MEQNQISKVDKKNKQDFADERWSKDGDKNLIKRLQKYCVKQSSVNLQADGNKTSKVKQFVEVENSNPDPSKSKQLPHQRSKAQQELTNDSLHKMIAEMQSKFLEKDD